MGREASGGGFPYDSLLSPSTSTNLLPLPAEVSSMGGLEKVRPVGIFSSPPNW